MSSVKTIICLANSRKHGAYCVAGIEPSSGRWIRPVSDLEDGRIERDIRLVNGRSPELGEMLKIPLASTGPDFAFQSENLSLTPGAWSSEGKIPPTDLLRLCSRDELILHNSQNFVTVQYLQSLPFEQRRTLQLIETRAFMAFSDGISVNGGHKWKSRFVSVTGQRLGAMITDPVLVDKLEQGYRPNPHCLVTVSLSMPYRPRGWIEEGDPCWKLIAGVIEMGEGTFSRPRVAPAPKVPAVSVQRADDDLPEADAIDDERIFGALRRVFGFHSFRPCQEDIVRALLAKRDAFVVMPTSSGKSLCYQLPACLMPGMCLVISPLISLMKDQVDAAVDHGLRAGCLNSIQTEQTRMATIRRMSKGELDLLYISPERFGIEVFLNNLKRIPLCLIAIDEAHCISEWGHDFRPDYLHLSSTVKHFPGVPMAAFTATATHRVQKDIIARLGLRNPYIVRASFNRPNLFYEVLAKEKPLDKILAFVKDHRGESGIIYRMTRKDVDRTVEMLRENGLPALPYHAGLDDQAREHNQEEFKRDRVSVIVATIAFGMGIDKPNVRYILHGDLPKSMESYYQETGRAGRDGEPAHCLLLFGRGDIPRIRRFIEPVLDHRERDRLRSSLQEMVTFAGASVCRRQRMLAYFGESYTKLPCDGCDVCRTPAERIDATTEAQMLLSAIVRTGERFGAGHIVGIVVGANSLKIRQFGHNTLKTYGVGKGKDKKYWRRMVDDMLAQELIDQSKGAYPTLTVQPGGWAVLRGEREFDILRQKEIRIQTEAQVPVVREFNKDLFQRLKEVRAELARQRDVPAYIIFHDRTLQEMASVLPRTHTELLRVSGVGEHKRAHYGQTFLDVINTFVKRHPGIAS